MTIQTTIQKAQAQGKTRRSLLLGLGVGLALAGVVALAGTAQRADAAFTEKVVFASDRTTGVDNPTGDFEIFRMNANGTGVRQLTANKVDDFGPVLSPDKTKVAYFSYGKQTSNPEGDYEIYVMNVSDATAKRNLTDNRADVNDTFPLFSPGGKKIAYTSNGKRASNPEGDAEVYVMRSLDGSGQKNLTHNGLEVPGSYPVNDYASDISPTGDKIAYVSYGKQGSNPEGDGEVYRMNALDGTAKRNLTHNGDGIDDGFAAFSPDGKTIAYETSGVQMYNAEGDKEIYSMSALDGKNKKNLTNNQDGVNDSYPVYSPGGKRLAYQSYGQQPSNLEGDYDVYRMSALDGTGQTNLTDNKEDVDDDYPFFSSDGTKIFYESQGVQDSNLQGDEEIYRLNTSDGKDQKNLTDNDAFDVVYPD
jgi:Tol biopolymer transport system component